jgi:myosin-5
LKFSHLIDAEYYNITKNAMTTIGISEQEQQETWCLLIAILHLGNVVFNPLHEGCELDPSCIPSLTRACQLLQIDQDSITKTLLERKVSVGKENYDIKLTMEQAENARDALAMLLYQRLFDTLVKKMNDNIKSKKTNLNTIGILDIYG